MSTPGWEHFTCGCLMQSTGQPDAVAWKACPLHAQAEGMRACLSEFLQRLNTYSRPYLAGDPMMVEAWIAQARVILRATEGRGTP